MSLTMNATASVTKLKKSYNTAEELQNDVTALNGTITPNHYAWEGFLVRYDSIGFMDSINIVAHYKWVKRTFSKKSKLVVNFEIMIDDEKAKSIEVMGQLERVLRFL